MTPFHLFVSPHNDDETLFGSFIIQQLRPLVVIVYESHRQPRFFPQAGATHEVRMAETVSALTELLGAPPIVYNLGLSDDDENATRLRVSMELIKFLRTLRALPEQIIYPAWLRGGNTQHNLVADAVTLLAERNMLDGVELEPAPPCDDELSGRSSIRRIKGTKLVEYLTYTSLGKATEFDNSNRTGPWSGEPWKVGGEAIQRKLRALACYTTQLAIENTRPHFLRDQMEYYREVRQNG